MRKVLHNVSKYLRRQPLGILIIELILTLAIFALLSSGAIYFLAATIFNSQAAAQRDQASLYLQQSLEAIQTIDREAWNYLADSPTNTYGLELTGNTWSLVTTPDHPSGDDRYTRTITLEDIYRDTTTGDIVDSTATDATFDPHTRAVTTTLDWTSGQTHDSTITGQLYLTDWDAASQVDTTSTTWATGTRDNARISTIDDGELQIIQPTLEVGSVIANSTWQTVLLSNTYTQAVVIATPLSVNNSDSPFTARVKNVTATSFDVKLDFPTDATAPTSNTTDTVNYMVVEQGQWSLGDGSTKLEAGIVSSVTDVNCRTCGTWNKGVDVTYANTYTTAPLVFTQIVTETDSAWVTSFVSDDTSSSNAPGTDGFQVALNTAEFAANHNSAAEDIAYIVIQSEVLDSFEHNDFETDYTGVTVRGFDNTPYRQENFDQTYSSAPYVFLTELGIHATDGSWPATNSVTATQIQLYTDEDQTNDPERTTPNEGLGYMAFVQAGTYYLNDTSVVYDEPPMEVGVVTGTTTAQMEVGTTTATPSWSTVSLTNTYTTPVVVASVLDGNNLTTPLSVRVKNASGNSFQVRLDVPTDATGVQTGNSETIYYMVVEAGVWRVGDGGTKIEAGIKPSVSRVMCRVGCSTWTGGTAVVDTNGYSVGPVVLHQVMSENDASWITSFTSNMTDSTSPPGTNGFQLALNGAEVTTSHLAEDIGYITIQSERTDTSGGVTFETDTTGDIVRGFDDARYSESFDQTYTAAPLVLVSQMSMDGIEGSWAMIDNVTASTLTMYEDEDQLRDAERSHQSEDFGYVAFAQAGSYTLTDNNFLASPVNVTLQQTYTNPVIITMPLLTSDVNSPASTRVYDVTGTGFTLKLDFPTDRRNPVNNTYSDKVYYLVMEAGEWEIDGMKIEAHSESISTVANSSSWTGTTKTFSHHYDDPPVVLHQVMSNTDTAWISSWVSRVGSRLNPPSRSTMQLALNAAQVTTSRGHGAETVGWIAMENVGNGTVDGEDFSTYTVTEFGRGHDEVCNSYTHGETYTNPVVLASQMSMDGSDGSWAVGCDVSSTTVGFHYEEDQYIDTERSHEDEAIGLIVFGDTFDFAGAVNTSNLTTATYESPVIGDGSTQRNYNIIEWAEETDCANCDIQVQVRAGTSPTAVASVSYVGPDGATTSYFSDPAGDLLPTSLINLPYLQYFITLSGSTAQSPRLDDVTTTYYGN